MMKSFFKASVATVVSAVMVIGMSSCGDPKAAQIPIPMRSRPSIQARPPAT